MEQRKEAWRLQGCSTQEDLTEKSVEKPPVCKVITQREQSGNKSENPKSLSEMSLKNVKCFKYGKKGHMAKTCRFNETDGLLAG